MAERIRQLLIFYRVITEGFHGEVILKFKAGQLIQVVRNESFLPDQVQAAGLKSA